MTGETETNIVETIKQLKENQNHIIPKQFKVQRNNNNFQRGVRGFSKEAAEIEVTMVQNVPLKHVFIMITQY